MKKYSVAIVLSFVFIFACSFAADWIVIRKADAGFKIAFPRKPQEEVQDVPTAVGKLKMHILMCDQSKYKDENLLYTLIYADYPENTVSSDFKDALVDTFFSNAITGAAGNMKGNILTVKNISYKSYPGRQVKISFADDQAYMYMDLYLVKSRMYFLQAGCEKTKDNNESIERFFKSFELSKP